MTDARSITHALRGRWRGRFGMAPCPICQPERRRGQNALTISEKGGRLLLHCKKSGCAFRDLLAVLGVDPRQLTPPDPVAEARWRAEEEAETEKRNRLARRVWDETVSIRGTPAEATFAGAALGLSAAQRL
jgi:hypothetical protein